jgi:hypothetical protein
MDTYIHTYIHGRMGQRESAFRGVLVHVYIHTYIHTYMHACIHTYREEWDSVNQRSEEYSQFVCRIKEVQALFERTAAIEEDKKGMTKK